MQFSVRFFTLFSFFKDKLLRAVHDGKSSKEFLVNPGVSEGSVPAPTLTPAILVFLVLLSVILVSDFVIIFFTLGVTALLIHGNSLGCLLHKNLTYMVLWTGLESGLLISILGKLNCLIYHSNNSDIIDVKLDKFDRCLLTC